MKKTYKETHLLEKRKEKADQFKAKYPDMTPIIVEKHKKCKLADLQRTQFLVNSHISFAEFKVQIKSKLQLQHSQTLFFYSGNVMITDNEKVIDLYNKHKDKDDGFLYILYSDCEVFGHL